MHVGAVTYRLIDLHVLPSDTQRCEQSSSLQPRLGGDTIAWRMLFVPGRGGKLSYAPGFMRSLSGRTNEPSEVPPLRRGPSRQSCRCWQRVPMVPPLEASVRVDRCGRQLRNGIGRSRSASQDQPRSRDRVGLGTVAFGTTADRFDHRSAGGRRADALDAAAAEGDEFGRDDRSVARGEARLATKVGRQVLPPDGQAKRASLRGQAEECPGGIPSEWTDSNRSNDSAGR